MGGKPASAAAAAMYEVAPGIYLPPNGMVWILDRFQNDLRENDPRERDLPKNGRPENHPHLARIDLNVVHENGHRTENLVRAQLLVVKMSESFDLPGATAKLRVSGHTPSIFVHQSEQEEAAMQSSANAKAIQEHYVLLRLHNEGKRRLIGTYSCWQLGLKCGRHVDLVESSTEEVADGGWLKIVPKQPLQDGEYAVAPLPDNERQFDSSLYDFGVGPVGK